MKMNGISVQELGEILENSNLYRCKSETCSMCKSRKRRNKYVSRSDWYVYDISVGVDKMTTAQEENRKQILEIQKSLMSAILQYQILYGTESIAGWNVSVNLNIQKEMKK